MNALTAPERETVTTWADGFGRWHARVTFPGGYELDHMNVTRSIIYRERA